MIYIQKRRIDMGMGMAPQNWEEMAAEPVEETDDVKVVVNPETTPDETSVPKTKDNDEKEKEA